jgi:hypothetical protein
MNILCRFEKDDLEAFPDLTDTNGNHYTSRKQFRGVQSSDNIIIKKAKINSRQGDSCGHHPAELSKIRHPNP